MDTTNRIFFKDNPFPQGHPIKAFSWSGAIDPERGLVFHFHLTTEDYNLEDKSEDLQDELPDWKSKSVWNNYHKCTLSSKDRYEGGIAVSKGQLFDFENLQMVNYTADALPLEEDWDPDNLAFSIYLLGHDSCAGHHIKINRLSGNTFNINWIGKIALTYAGEDDFDYAFEANIGPITFDGIHYPKEWSQEQALKGLSALISNPGQFTFEDLNPKSFKREYKLVWRP